MFSALLLFSVHGSCSLHDQFEACFSKPVRTMILSGVDLSNCVNRKFSQDVTEEETTEEIVTTEQVDFREVLKKVRNEITQC